MIINPKRFRIHFSPFSPNESIMLYSMWYGCRTRSEGSIPSFLKLTGKWEPLHTSGHASPADIQNLIEKCDPDVIIPIHTDKPAALQSLCPYTKQKNCTFGNEFRKHIAAVNIKKSGGAEKSNGDDLMAYAQYDKAEIYEQLQIIDPTVIICGYTMEYLNIIMPEPIKERAGQSQNLFYRTQLNGHDVLVLDYWHPSSQYPDIMNYYTLMGIYQQALISSRESDFVQ